MKYLRVVSEALREARKAVTPLFGQEQAARGLGIGAFGDRTYAIDRAAEESILKVLRKRIPDACVVTEETGMIGDQSGEVTVLVDPIDGSTNATRSVPLFSTAIVIAEGSRFQDVVAAGVMDLVHNEEFLGSKGGLATVNGSNMTPTSNRDLGSAYISMNPKAFSAGTKGRLSLQRLLAKTRYPRSLGSAALETAYVAAGRIDAFIDPTSTLRLFDCIPSIYLTLKAGGFVECIGYRIEDVNLRKRVNLGFVATGTEALGRTILGTIKG